MIAPYMVDAATPPPEPKAEVESQTERSRPSR
jgi:hypothetical protein